MIEKYRKFFSDYYYIPSSKGFSPYRTGQSVHVMLSALATVSAIWMFSNLVILSIFHKAAIALGIVLLLWGAGVQLGIESHYNLFVTLPIVIVFIVLIVINPNIVIDYGLGIGSHFFVRGILVMIQKKNTVK